MVDSMSDQGNHKDKYRSAGMMGMLEEFLNDVRARRAVTKSYNNEVGGEYMTEKNRVMVVTELMETEKAYLSDLKYFLEPVRKEKVVPQTDITTIFGNIEQIFDLHNMLYATLTDRLGSIADNMNAVNSTQKPLLSILSEIFLAVVVESSETHQKEGTFLVYDHYCVNFKKANDAMVECTKRYPAFQQLQDRQAALPELKGLFLRDYLIKPIQRICKYPLLFERLLKQTPRENIEYDTLEGVKTRIEDVALKINLSRHEAEMDKLATPGRRIVKEGELIKVAPYTDKPQLRYCFLFNDKLIYTRRKGKKSFQFRGEISLNGVEILDLPDDSLRKRLHGFKVFCSNLNREFCFHAPSPEQQQEWVGKLRKHAIRTRQRASSSTFMISSGQMTSGSSSKPPLPHGSQTLLGNAGGTFMGLGASGGIFRKESVQIGLPKVTHKDKETGEPNLLDQLKVELISWKTKADRREGQIEELQKLVKEKDQLVYSLRREVAELKRQLSGGTTNTIAVGSGSPLVNAGSWPQKAGKEEEEEEGERERSEPTDEEDEEGSEGAAPWWRDEGLSKDHLEKFYQSKTQSNNRSTAPPGKKPLPPTPPRTTIATMPAASKLPPVVPPKPAKKAQDEVNLYSYLATKPPIGPSPAKSNSQQQPQLRGSNEGSPHRRVRAGVMTPPPLEMPSISSSTPSVHSPASPGTAAGSWKGSSPCSPRPPVDSTSNNTSSVQQSVKAPVTAPPNAMDYACAATNTNWKKKGARDSVLLFFAQ
ncbi:Round spore [Balamuthia mandrillaris]